MPFYRGRITVKRRSKKVKTCFKRSKVTFQKVKRENLFFVKGGLFVHHTGVYRITLFIECGDGQKKTCFLFLKSLNFLSFALNI